MQVIRSENKYGDFQKLMDAWYVVTEYADGPDRSKANTEEIIQDIFPKVWMRKKALIGLRSFESYLR